MKLGKSVRNVLSSGLVAALVLTSVGLSGGVVDAATKTKTTAVTKKAPVKKVVKKFDYAKYRKDQTKVVTGYSSTLRDFNWPGSLPTPSYVKSSIYAKDVASYNVASSKYRTTYDATYRESRKLLQVVKAIDTTKEKDAYVKRVASLKSTVSKLKTESRALSDKGSVLYKWMTNYEKRQLALFEAKYGDVSDNLKLIDFHDYLDGLERNLSSSGKKKAEIVEIMDQAHDRMLDKHEISNELIGAKRGAIYTLVYEGKMEEANVVFQDARDNALTIENAKLDEAYNAIIISYLYKK